MILQPVLIDVSLQAALSVRVTEPQRDCLLFNGTNHNSAWEAPGLVGISPDFTSVPLWCSFRAFTVGQPIPFSPSLPEPVLGLGDLSAWFALFWGFPIPVAEVDVGAGDQCCSWCFLPSMWLAGRPPRASVFPTDFGRP